MPRGRNRRPTTTGWRPPTGWVEYLPLLWAPVGYVPSEWERPQPRLETDEDVRREYSRSARSLDYFALTYCWTLDVDDPLRVEQEPSHRIPAYPYVRAYLQGIQEPSNTLTEKSRQVLLTWMAAATCLWDILFHEGWADLYISRTDRKVDDGGEESTVDSALGRVRFIWNHLPAFLQHPTEFKKNRVLCTTTNSYIAGETANTEVGRAGNYDRAFFDETAHAAHGESAFRALKSAAKRSINMISSPNGKGNVFYRVRHNPHSTFHRFTIHWSENPRNAQGLYCGTCGWQSRPEEALPHLGFRAHACTYKDSSGRDANPKARSPWYDAQTAPLTEEQIGSEYDISYETSVRGRVYKTFNAVRHVIEHEWLVNAKTGRVLGPRREGELLSDYRDRYLRTILNPQYPLVVGWDFGVDDPTVLVLGQVYSEELEEVDWLDSYHGTDESWEHYASWFTHHWLRPWQSVGGQAIHEIAHYGDPSGENRQSDLMSWITNLAKGVPAKKVPPIRVQFNTVQRPKKRQWIDHIRTLYRKDRWRISTFAAYLLDATSQYHWPTDENGELKIGQHEPVHDKWSHPCDAKRYVVQTRWPHKLYDANAIGVKTTDLLIAGGNVRGYEQREF